MFGRMKKNVDSKRRHQKYRPLSHTADLGLRIWGATLEDLYANAGEALTATITDRRQLKAREQRKITVEAPDREALLVALLNHLLYLYDIDGFLGREFAVRDLSPERLTATARGEIFDPERHVGKTAVKAATYHQLEITRTEDGWQATVILDL
jgi:SHS2 domain-containing protein